jgi:hypothetical protein
MSFFPPDLDLENTQSPEDILTEAKAEWQAKGQGILSLVIDRICASDGSLVTYNVYAMHVPSSRIEHIFSVLHEKEKAYPASIEINQREIPRDLKKSYTIAARPGGAFFKSTVEVLNAALPERKIINEWVSESPSEFNEKLQRAFGLGSVKSEITNLIAGPLAPGIDSTSDEDTDKNSDESLNADET